MDTWLAVLFTAVVSPVIVILIGLFLEYKTGIFVRDKKEITISVVSKTILISPKNKTISDKLEIKYDGRDIKSLVSLVFRVENTGNVPIASSDYEEPLKISFGEKILEHSVANPTSIGPTPYFKQFSPLSDQDTPLTFLEIEPLLINQGESFVVSVLLPEFNQKNLHVTGRIIGTQIATDYWESKLKQRQSLFLDILDSPIFLFGMTILALLVILFFLFR